MRSELERIQQIEQYLLGEASEEEIQNIETKMEEDATFRKQVEQQQLLMQAIQRKAWRESIEQFQPPQKPPFWKWGLGFIMVLLVFGGLYLMMKEEVVEKPHENDRIEQAVKKTIDTVVIENIQDTVTVKLASQVGSTPPKEREINFRGLKMWVEPEVQTFEVIAENGAVVEGQDGIVVVIPENCFVNSVGSIISGKVDFELVEAITMDDILLYNLTTTSEGSMLETGGMFYTNATQNGTQLFVNPDRPMYIELPTADRKAAMMAFEGEVTEGGNINWKNPKPLQKYLVKRDFKDLDFLPKGFEERVLAETPETLFYFRRAWSVDSLYYTMTREFTQDSVIEKNKPNTYIVYERNTPIEFTEWVKVKDTISVTKKGKGISPLAIKAIQQAPFANTFIATQEFEERLQALHRVANGDELLNLYVNNLSKPMWEIDEMVSQRLSGTKRLQFEQFRDQKLTNLEDVKVYQEQLSAFYKKKLSEEGEQLVIIRRKLRAKTTKELKELQDALAEKSRTAKKKFIELPIKAPSVASSKVYATPWYQFGWVNIDRYLKLLDGKQKRVIVSAKSIYKDVKVYQWLNVIKTLTPIFMVEGSGNTLFPNPNSKEANEMSNITAIAIARKGKQFRWGYVEYRPYEVDSISISLDTVSVNELKIQLRQLNVGADPLVRKLSNIDNLIREEAERDALKEKLYLQRMNEDMALSTKLKKITQKEQQALKKKEEELKMREQYLQDLRDICFVCQIETDSLGGVDKPIEEPNHK